MRSLLIICQKVDEQDDLLGFFIGWIREFAKHFGRINVITLAAGVHDLPSNVRVYSLGKELGISKWRQAVKIAGLLWKLAPHKGGIFCHMSPIFAIIAWPYAILRRSKLVLWYLHRSLTLRLRIALAICDKLVTANEKGLAIKSPKIVSVGHGVDVMRFAVSGRQFDIANRPLRILSVGRLAPIKDFKTLIRATKILHDRSMAVEVRIVGRPILPDDIKEELELHDLVKKLSLNEIVKFVGLVSYPDMPEQYRWADIVVGCTPRGGIDKALLEGMAAGCVAITSNDAMRSSLEPYGNALLFAYGDARQLTNAIVKIDHYEGISSMMISNVRKYHDLHTTIYRIHELL